MKKGIKKMIAVICISLAALVAALAVVLLVLSPGTMPAPAGKDGISEKVFVEIGGVRQGMFLRGADTGNPVLLYVHGGPGMPTYFLAEKTAAPLEESFTVCYWEQRGAGLSWSADMDPSAITTEQLVDDTIEVAAYLSERFGQEKVLLVGHSWGSYIAIQAAEKAPERFSAYVGIAQVSDTARAGEIAWQYLIDRYEEEGNEKRLAALRALPAVTTDEGAYAFFNAPIRETAQHELGVGSTHEMRSVVTGIFFPQLACRAYTLPEKVAFWRAKAFLRKETKLGDEVFAANLFEEVPRLEVPAYFMSGAYDYTVPWELSQEYLEALEAPDKGFYLFEDSAHSPIFEEPERFAEVLQEVAKP